MTLAESGLGFSTKLVIVGLYQGLLLFLVVTRLVTWALAALGLLTHVNLSGFLLQILVDSLQTKGNRIKAPQRGAHKNGFMSNITVSLRRRGAREAS